MLQPDVFFDKYDWLQELTNNINSHIKAYAFTPHQRDVITANTISTVLKVKRRMEMDNANK